MIVETIFYTRDRTKFFAAFISALKWRYSDVLVLCFMGKFLRCYSANSGLWGSPTTLSVSVSPRSSLTRQSCLCLRPQTQTIFQLSFISSYLPLILQGHRSLVHTIHIQINVFTCLAHFLIFDFISQMCFVLPTADSNKAHFPFLLRFP